MGCSSGEKTQSKRGKMQFAKVNGGVTCFADEGPRDAPAVVLINSLGTDFRIWDDVAWSLTGRYIAWCVATSVDMDSRRFGPVRQQWWTSLRISRPCWIAFRLPERTSSAYRSAGLSRRSFTGFGRILSPP